jgi:hypothetical protein
MLARRSRLMRWRPMLRLVSEPMLALAGGGTHKYDLSQDKIHINVI